MSKLFAPVEGLMQRVSLSSKMLLIGVVCLAPAAFLLSMLVPKLNGEIEFSAKELVGVRAIMRLSPLIAAAQEHRSAEQKRAAGIAGAEAQAERARQAAAGVFDTIEQSGKDELAQLDATSAWNGIVAVWSALNTDKNKS